MVNDIKLFASKLHFEDIISDEVAEKLAKICERDGEDYRDMVANYIDAYISFGGAEWLDEV